MTLNEYFAAHPKAAMGFSGGVDSSYLLYAAVQAGVDVRPYYIKTAFQPAFELRDAQRLCAELGLLLRIVELDILAAPDVAQNPENRCYHCKTALFGALKKAALAEGYDLLWDGTNASDSATDRPGMKALTELQVASPLREAGLTKADLRRLSKEAGLFTWNKPAYACLATRIPAGTAIDEDTLQKIEGAENALFDLGYSDFRVRVLNGAARIQLKSDDLHSPRLDLSAIKAAVSNHFDTVLLDLEGR